MNLIERIKQSNSLMSSSLGARPNSIERCQKKLCTLGAAPMPLSYADFLSQLNGIYGQGISVFGVDAIEPWDDIYKKNSLTGAISKNKIFLGYSLTEYLIYDWYEKSYIVIDQKTNKNILVSPFLDQALACFCREYM